MRRPNPWIVIPSLAMGLLAGSLGWVVTEVSCRQSGAGGVIASCYGWATLIAVVAFVGATVGVGILLVLVYRSLTEWRERSEPGSR